MLNFMPSRLLSLARRLAVTLVMISTGPFTANAQTLRDDLYALFEVDFLRGFYPGTPDSSGTVGAMLGAQISTFPLSSSSSGFTWRFDPGLGLLVRDTRTFGPTLAERPSTIGPRKIAVGFTRQALRYSGLGGRDLRGLNVWRIEVPSAAALTLDALDLELSSSTDLFFVSAGATDRLEFAVAVPFVVVDLAGTTTRTFNNRQIFQVKRNRTAKGLGDVALRTKYQLGRFGGNDTGVSVDVRVPSGDADNFLGTGKTSIKVTGLLSRAAGRVSPYVNVGITGGGVSKEVGYIGGVDIGLSSRVSVATDIVGRRLLDVADYTESTTRQAQGTSLLTVATAGAKGLNLALWTVGLKVNVARTLLLTGTAITSVTKGGLRARFTPVIGIDYAF